MNCQKYILLPVLVLSFFFVGLVDRSVSAQKLTTKERKILSKINNKLYVHKNHGLKSYSSEVKTVLMFDWRYEEKGIELKGGWPVIAFYWELKFDPPNNYSIEHGRTDLFTITNDEAYGYEFQRMRGLSRFKDNSTQIFVKKYRRNLKRRLSLFFRRFIVTKPFDPIKNDDLYMYLKDEKKRAYLVEDFGVPEDVKYVFDYDGEMRGMVFEHPKLAPYPYNVHVPVTKFNMNLSQFQATEERVPERMIRRMESDWEFYEYGPNLKERPEEPIAEKYYGSKKVGIGTRLRLDMQYANVSVEGSVGNRQKTELILPRKIIFEQTGLMRDERRAKILTGGSANVETQQGGGSITGGGWEWLYSRRFTGTYREHIVFLNLEVNGTREGEGIKTESREDK